MKKVEIWQVDAFTRDLFGGNPAGVVPEANGLTESDMQNIAREMNLSETAFVLPPEKEGADFRVRFFTPAAEVDLCGHATIAAFHTLAWKGAIRASEPFVSAVQQTFAGLLPVKIYFSQGSVKGVEMEQAPHEHCRALRSDKIAEIIGLPEARLDPRFPIECSYSGLWAVMIGVKEIADLERLAVDRERIVSAAPDIAKLSGLYIFAWDGGKPRARFFVNPAYDIVEDPFTGTATGAFGGYLHKHGKLETGKYLLCRQGYEMGRPGEGEVKVEAGGKIVVRGGAVKVFRAEIG